ncbi:hypothetical protein KKB18_00935, partial [bacterium]|nr:hypothetical protein [bacterium]
KGIELIIKAIDLAYKEIEEGYKNLDVNDSNFIKWQIDPIFNLGTKTNEDEDQIAKDIYKIKDISKKIQLAKIISATHLLLNASREFEYMILSAPQVMNWIIENKIITNSWGKIEISGRNNDKHIDGSTIIIDLGGDDNYDITGSSEEKKLVLIIDLFGNDNYKVGASSSGITIIIDSSGNDIYVGNGFCLGAGIIGAGVIWDKGGDDIYKSDFASLGFGALGIGLLVDDGGNDLYTSLALSQGASILSGLGILLDRAGNDIYRAGDKYPDDIRDPKYYLSMSQGFGFGLRPFTSGGLGILIDDDGSDKYIGGVFGQGAGYWHSAGLLWDNSGDDYYISRQYSQGCGIHSGFGMLVDIDGNDTYNSYSQAQGCGYDLSVGFLIDKGGDDTYIGEWHVQGAGARNSFAFFLDSSGRDRYIAGEDGTSRGYADRYRDYGGIGLFLDMKGNDIFIPQKPTKDNFWSYNPFSAAFDGEF